MKRIDELAKRVAGAVVHGDGAVTVRGIAHDSRAVQPGWLFAALPGARVDGAQFASQAVANGAAALLCERAQPVSVPQLVVPDARAALGAIAAAIYGDPAASLQVVGITGTNGKTTVAHLLAQALEGLGHPCGVMGTVGHRFGAYRVTASHTTPEAPVVQQVLAEMRDRGATHVVMEASSHGLALGRLSGTAFRVAAFTNLTQDHLDFHGDMATYGAAKAQLFAQLAPGGTAVVNTDDPFGAALASRISEHPVLRVSCRPDVAADIRPVRPPAIDSQGIDADIITPQGVVSLRSPMVGAHNLSNLLVALGILVGLGEDAAAGACHWRDCHGAPGRLERIPSPLGFAVLVDYAHTPDALSRILSALRPLTAGRLICVFGCGGDRDHAKRPLMGRAVAQGADIAVVTSDNPRTEPPEAIIEMILPGLDDAGMPQLTWPATPGVRSGYWVASERADAIANAIDFAAPGDTIVIAGKGHEDYQIVGTTSHHFDDAAQARAALQQRKDKGD